MPDNVIKIDPQPIEMADVNKAAYHRAEVIALNCITVLKSIEAPLALLKLTEDHILRTLAAKSIADHLDALDIIARVAGGEVVRVAKPPLLMVPGTKVLQ